MTLADAKIIIQLMAGIRTDRAHIAGRYKTIMESYDRRLGELSFQETIAREMVSRADGENVVTVEFARAK